MNLLTRISAVAVVLATAPAFADVIACVDPIRIPKAQFEAADPHEAFTFLMQKTRALTADNRGLNVLFDIGPEPAKPVTFNLENVPAREVARYIGEGAGLILRWEPGALVVSSKPGFRSAAVHFTDGTKPIRARLAATTVPGVRFADTPLDEAMEFLRNKGRQLDREEKGFNLVVSPGVPEPPKKTEEPELVIPGLTPEKKPEPEKPVGPRLIKLDATEIEFLELIRLAASVGGQNVRVDANAIVVGPGLGGQRPLVQNSVAFKGKVLSEKLAAITIPAVKLRDVSVADAATFLSRKIKALDPMLTTSNVLVHKPDDKKRITLALENVSALDALRYTAEAAGMTLRIEHHAFVLVE